MTEFWKAEKTGRKRNGEDVYLILEKYTTKDINDADVTIPANSNELTIGEIDARIASIDQEIVNLGAEKTKFQTVKTEIAKLV